VTARTVRHVTQCRVDASVDLVGSALAAASLNVSRRSLVTPFHLTDTPSSDVA